MPTLVSVLYNSGRNCVKASARHRLSLEAIDFSDGITNRWSTTVGGWIAHRTDETRIGPTIECVGMYAKPGGSFLTREFVLTGKI
jgi:hypothetical protein